MLLVASIIRGYHKYKDVWSDRFASASGDGKIDIFAPQVSTHTCTKFRYGSQKFNKKWI